MVKRKGKKAKGNLGIRTRADYEKNLKNAKYFAYIFLLFSSIILVVIVISAILNIGVANFLLVLRTFDPIYFFASMFVVSCGFLLRYPKWQIYMKRLRLKISTIKSFLIYLSFNSMNLTPGRSGRLLISYTINKITGADFGKTAPAVVADLFTDFFGYILITIAVALLVGKYLFVSVIAGVLLLIPFAILYNDTLYRMAKSYFQKRNRFKRFFDFGDTYFKNTKLLSKRIYFATTVFALPSEVMTGLSLYLILVGFGVPLTIGDLPLIFFIYSSSVLLGIVSGIPGSIGVTEVGILGYLTLLLHLNYAVAAMATILFGLSNLWFTEIVGFASLAYIMRYWN